MRLPCVGDKWQTNGIQCVRTLVPGLLVPVDFVWKWLGDFAVYISIFLFVDHFTYPSLIRLTGKEKSNTEHLKCV